MQLRLCKIKEWDRKQRCRRGFGGRTKWRGSRWWEFGYTEQETPAGFADGMHMF